MDMNIRKANDLLLRLWSERASERVSVEYYGIHMWDYEYKIKQHMQKEKAKMETCLILDKM